MIYQVLKSDYDENPWFKDWSNVVFKNSLEDIDPLEPIITGSVLTHVHVQKWLNQKQPAIYIGRGYVGNHLFKTRWLWRYSINGWANIKLRPMPHSRWSVMQLDKHPWKVRQVKNVLIAPSAMTAPIWSPEDGWQWAEHMARQFPGADVRIRYKIKKSGARWATLFQDLYWADLVVAQGSAITAEALWYGKKAISLHPCITWAAGAQSLQDWQNPSEPVLRDQWHEHLAWSQFTNEEWQSGRALELIEQYAGSVVDFEHDHDYNFKTNL
jgi:hypothetical protein